METEQSAIAYSVFLVVSAAAVAIEHMAFSTPRWKKRELMRRALGEFTILALFYFFCVVFGGMDVRTWAMLASGFIVAGAVKVGFQWWDDARRGVLMERFNNGRDEGQNQR